MALELHVVTILLGLLAVFLTQDVALSSAPLSDYLTPGFRPPAVPLVVVDPYLRSVTK